MMTDIALREELGRQRQADATDTAAPKVDEGSLPIVCSATEGARRHGDLVLVEVNGPDGSNWLGTRQHGSGSSHAIGAERET